MAARKSVSPLVIISLVLFVFIAMGIYFSGPDPVYCQQSFANRDHRVVMFGSRTCPYCRQARIMFEQNKIPYCEYKVNASLETQQAFIKLGGQGVPLILIDNEVFHGFNETIISEELERQGLLKQANKDN